MLVQGPSHQLLARAALAGDQDWHILTGHPADRFINLLHRGASANDGVSSVVDRLALGNHGRYLHHAANGQGSVDNLSQLREFQGLQEIFESPQFHRFNGRVGRTFPRYKDHGATGVDLS